jgi:hypothetical protein
MKGPRINAPWFCKSASWFSFGASGQPARRLETISMEAPTEAMLARTSSSVTAGGAGQEVAAETEHDFELDAQHRKIAACQGRAAGVDALAGQGGALDWAVCGFGADFPAADAELAPAQEGLLGLVSGGTVGRRQPRRDQYLHGLLRVGVTQQVAQFFGRGQVGHGGVGKG